jgi:hypothetical protein
VTKSDVVWVFVMEAIHVSTKEPGVGKTQYKQSSYMLNVNSTTYVRILTAVTPQERTGILLPIVLRTEKRS